MSELFRLLPSMDACLDRLASDPALAGLPRALVRDLATGFLDRCRQSIRQGEETADTLAPEALWPRLEAHVHQGARPHFRRVINATGVVAHTNMGRSPLAREAADAAHAAALHYSNLEFDLATGERGSRYSHVVDLILRLTGAEDALVVNNNAAAVFLMLNTLCAGREVVVSRGQLVEIGGSFRIPDVMRSAGVVLREVGATNRTHPADYERAIGPDTAALMRVHCSNYKVVGFTSEVGLPELRAMADAAGLPVLEDLGSGNLLDAPDGLLRDEPSVRRVLAQGADIATFSGDKVLGGPQAGILAGRAELIGRIRKNPLNRAMRIDKMTLAALEATLRLYLDPQAALERIPTLRMIHLSPAALASRAGRLSRLLRQELGRAARVRTLRGVSRVGGGAFPEKDLETTLVGVAPDSCPVEELRRRLLSTDPPLVGRVEEGELRLDPRTLDIHEYKLAAGALRQALGLTNRPE